MKKLLILFSIIFTGCEITDVQVIDFETALPTENKPFVVEEGLRLETVTQLNTGSIVFSVQDRSTSQWYLGIRKITGEVLMRDIDYALYPHPYTLGSIGNEIIQLDLNRQSAEVYGESLDWKGSYEVHDPAAYATGHNKATWSDGTKLYHLSPASEFRSSALTDSDGGIVLYPEAATDFLHTSSYTFINIRVKQPSYPYDETLYAVKYDQAFNFVDGYEINLPLLFANDRFFYVGELNVGAPSEIDKYSTNGEFIEAIQNFSLPDNTISRRFLEDGNLAVLYESRQQLQVLSIDNGDILWELPLGQGERILSFDIAQDGKFLVSTRTSGYGLGEYYSIYLVEPSY